jgi:hypothetical protein
VGAAVGVATTKIPKQENAEQMFVNDMLLTAPKFVYQKTNIGEV